MTFPAVVCTFVWKLRQCGRYSGGTVRPLSTYKLICFDPRDMDIIQREWRRHRGVPGEHLAFFAKPDPIETQFTRDKSYLCLEQPRV